MDQLTPDLLANVLQFVPLSDRHQHAALVNSKWRDAAASATQHISLDLSGKSEEQEEQLAGALDSYLGSARSQQLTSLVLEGYADRPVRHLPPTLVSLDIKNGRLHLGSVHGSEPLAGVLDACTALTRLVLDHCVVTGCLDKAAAVLTDLCHLHLADVRTLSSGHLATLCCSVLPTHLTYLHLHLGVEHLHHISTLTNLVVLHIVGVENGEPLLLAPSMLAPLSRLTSLELSKVQVEGCDGMSSGYALLAALADLPALKVLELYDLEDVEWPPAATCTLYTALLTQPKQEVTVYACNLPDGVWEAVFAPDARHSYPSLSYFHCYEEAAEEDDPWLYWDADAVDRFVECCPALCSLDVPVLPAALAGLTALTTLINLVTYVDCNQLGLPDVELSVNHLAALTRLHKLDVQFVIAYHEAEQPDAAGTFASALLPLTNLCWLLRCKVWLGSDPDAPVLDWEFVNQSPVLDVWLQLLEKCLSTSNCHPAVITTLRNQASTFFGRTLALQQQVNGLQQQVWQSAMRAHMHEQQIMQHQCLAAQQQQQLMTQQQQIVELQAQVQQLLQRLPPQM